MKIIALATFRKLPTRQVDYLFPQPPGWYDWAWNTSVWQYWNLLQKSIENAFKIAEVKIPVESIPTSKITTNEFIIDTCFFYISKYEATYYLLQCDAAIENEQACAITLPLIDRLINEQNVSATIEDFIDGLNNTLKKSTHDDDEKAQQPPIINEKDRLLFDIEHAFDDEHQIIKSVETIEDFIEKPRPIKTVSRQPSQNTIPNRQYPITNTVGGISGLVKITDSLSQGMHHTLFHPKKNTHKPAKWKESLKATARSISRFFGSLFCCYRRPKPKKNPTSPTTKIDSTSQQIMGI